MTPAHRAGCGTARPGDGSQQVKYPATDGTSRAVEKTRGDGCCMESNY